MKSRFPDLTFFLDTAGRYSQSKDLPIVICAVAVESRAVVGLRESLLQVTKGRPVKWSLSKGDHYVAKEIFRLLAKRQLFWSVRIIWKNTPEWDRYFEDGHILYRKVVRNAQEAAPYAKPWYTFMLHQFNRASAHLLGFYFGHHPRKLPRRDGPIQPITITAVHDSDIQGEVNQKVFRDVLEGIKGDLPRVLEATRIKPLFEASIKTEQAEPLLLLPDHIAGYYYSLRAYGVPSESEEEKGSLFTAIEPLFKQIPKSCYRVEEEQFREPYLLGPTTFDYVLPKKKRETLLKALLDKKAQAQS